MANQIMTIKPYRWEGMWVFDDDRVGLHREPFVAGADTIIDALIAEKGIANAAKGFVAVFSGDPFPGADVELTWRVADANGVSDMLKVTATPGQRIAIPLPPGAAGA